MGVAILVRASAGDNDCAPSVIVLTLPTTTIGRRGNVRMDTPTGHEISKVHTIFSRVSYLQGDIWSLKDNGSMNGTFVNSQKTQRRRLSEGDEIVFGGGPNFRNGDSLESTEQAYCRYFFFTVDPTVRFSKTLDPNAALATPGSDEFCPICYATLESPEVLPCGHCFCLKCVQDWAHTCRQTCRNTVCPMCRAPFLQSQLRSFETRMVQGQLEVCSVEGMLRDLKARSCRVIKGVQIFKSWTDQHKKWFWKAFASVVDVPERRMIFLALAKATAGCVLSASREELEQALANFGLEANSDKDDMRRVLLLFIYANLRPKKSQAL
jgi:hypothetical protein